MAKIKKLFAKVKASEKLSRMVLFSGHEFVKTEFRRVPAGFENQAKNDDRVETRQQDVSAEDEVEEAVAPQTSPVVERITITDTEDQETDEDTESEDGEDAEESDGEEESDSEKPKSRRGKSKAK
jgi:hypothetical protein